MVLLTIFLQEIRKKLEELKECYRKRKKQQLGTNLCGSQAIKLAVSAGSKIYANKSENEDGNV